MACSMSIASAPRTSPITIRSGRIRSAFFTSSRWVISPFPSTLAGRVSRRTKCSCCSCNSAASSMVTIRSSCGMNADNALSEVVLPEPVPPEIKIFLPIFTTAVRKAAIAADSAFFSTIVASVNGSEGNRRMVIVGPSNASGGIITLTLEPSIRRASAIGEDSSTRRPTRETIRSITRITCVSSSKTTALFWILPLFSTKT